MPTMTEEEALTIARAGADWFDSNLDPGWLAHVNADRLDVDNPRYCPLSQATGLHYNDATTKYGLTHADCIRFGFVDSINDNKTIDAAWRIVLRERANPVRALLAALKDELLARKPAGTDGALAEFIAVLARDPVAETIRMAGGKGSWTVEPDGSALWFIPALHPLVLIDRDILAQASRDAFAVYVDRLRPRGDAAIAAAVKNLITLLEQETAR